eukprot:1815007-Amphidinium_carterae.1
MSHVFVCLHRRQHAPQSRALLWTARSLAASTPHRAAPCALGFRVGRSHLQHKFLVTSLDGCNARCFHIQRPSCSTCGMEHVYIEDLHVPCVTLCPSIQASRSHRRSGSYSVLATQAAFE